MLFQCGFIQISYYQQDWPLVLMFGVISILGNCVLNTFAHFLLVVSFLFGICKIVLPYGSQPPDSAMNCKYLFSHIIICLFTLLKVILPGGKFFSIFMLSNSSLSGLHFTCVLTSPFRGGNQFVSSGDSDFDRYLNYLGEKCDICSHSLNASLHFSPIY